jgi:hypothetical protein
MLKILGYIVLLVGIWMMVCPQAILGLKELKWMANYAFTGEALLGALLTSGSFLLIRPSQPKIESTH